MKTRHRKKKGVLNVTGLPPYPIQRSKPLIRSDIIRAHTKLKHLIDLEQYDDAQFLFTELIKTSRYNIHNFWKVGAEIIGKTSPNQLADYLRAVFINSPNPLSLVTFDAYIDQLMLERKWANALEEIDLLFNRPQYHHPILLRKKAICCYQQWLEAKSALPESYLEEEVYDEYDTNIIRYERCVKTTSKNMAEAYQVYFRDVELLNMYFEFLKETKDEEAIQSAVAKSLESFNKNPDFYLLKCLMKVNEDDQYFARDQFILYLYEQNPLYDAKAGLKAYVKSTRTQLETLIHAESISNEYKSTAKRLFSIFICRVQSGIIEKWFLKSIVKSILKYALSQEMYKLYKTRHLDDLLNSSFVLRNTSEPKSVIQLAKKMKKILGKFNKKNKKEDKDEEMEQEEEQEKEDKEEVDEVKEEEKEEEDIVEPEVVLNDDDEEQKSSQHIPFLNDIAMLQEYFQHPLLKT